MASSESRQLWRRAFELAERALQLEDGRREEFLVEIEAQHADLGSRVRQLVQEDAVEFRAQPNSDATWSGRRIGTYTLLRRLGSGGAGVVYEAEQDRPRRRVALKLLREVVLDDEQRRRFEREIECLGKLSHPNIATLHEGGAITGPDGVKVWFYAMELVRDARTLVEYSVEHDVPVHRRLESFLRVCDAIAHAHERDVIHRDLKPGNLLVDAAGAVKVIDFGIARHLGAQPWTNGDATLAGSVLGTLGYMAPEQLEGKSQAIDRRTDVYALGLILCELATGRPALELGGRSIIDSIQWLRTATIRPPSALRSDLPRGIDSIVARCTERVRARRYPSVEELAHDVRCVIEGREISRPRFEVRERVRNTLLVAGVLAASFVVARIGSWSTPSSAVPANGATLTDGAGSVERVWRGDRSEGALLDPACWTNGAPGAIDSVVFAAENGANVLSDQRARLRRLEVRSGTTRIGGHGELVVDDPDAPPKSACLVIGSPDEMPAVLELASGTLRIGRVAMIGSEAGMQGSLRVVGPTARFETLPSGANGWFAIGEAGIGTLELREGATLSSTSRAPDDPIVTIADVDGSTGQALVTGAGSIWTAEGIICGCRGDGQLVIEDAGLVDCAGELWIGGNDRFSNGETGAGTLHVRGAGSRLLLRSAAALRPRFIVGSKGRGLLAVDDAGDVWSDAEFVVGDRPTSEGAVEVRGQAVLELVGSPNVERFTIGRAGRGRLHIVDGGHFIGGALLSVGDSYGGAGGEVVVRDAGSSLNIASLHIGTRATGELRVESGGIVAVASQSRVEADSSWPETAPRATETPQPAIANAGNAVDFMNDKEATLVGIDGDAVVGVLSGATLVTTGTVVCSVRRGGAARLRVQGVGSTWSLIESSIPRDQGQELIVGLAGSAELVVDEGARLECAIAVLLGKNTESEGTLRILGDGTRVAVRDLTCGSSFGARGTLELDGRSRLHVSGSLRLEPSARLRVRLGDHEDVAPLEVEGSASLAGELEVVPQASTRPASGLRVALLACRSVSGGFERISVAGAEGVRLRTEYAGDTLWLVAE